MGLAGGKYLIKNNFWHQNRDWDIQNIKYAKFQWILSIFNFGNNLGRNGGKYLIKVVFDIKIEIALFEISNIPNFNKSWAFLILAPIWA